MKLTVVLAVLVGIFVFACSSAVPEPAQNTPNIQATIEAGVMATRVAENVDKAIKATIAVPTQMPTLSPTATPVVLSDKAESQNTPAEEVFQQTGSSFVKKIHLESRFGFDITVPFSECPLTEISPETEEAINEIDKTIESEPHDAEAYLYRGWAYLSTHRYPQAISDLNKGIELSSSSVDVGLKFNLYNARSSLYECIGELHKAEQDQETIFELAPQGDMWAYYYRAYFRASHGQFELAMNDINKFIELSERDAGRDVKFDHDRVAMRADLLLASGRIGEAIADYSSVIEWFYDDDDVEHYGAYPSKFGRGVAHLRRQQYEMAIDDFTRAMDDTRPSSAIGSWSLPESVPFYGVARGIAYGMSGQFDEAIADFDKYIGEDQTYAIPYLFRGIALQTLGQSDLAEKDRAKACELDKELC